VQHERKEHGKELACDIVKKLSNLSLASNDKEFWDLYELAHTFDKSIIAHALAREYIKRVHKHVDVKTLLNPHYPLSEKARITLKKHYFLATKDKSVMSYETPDEQKITLTLTLHDVSYVRGLFVYNSHIDLSGLFLRSIDGIEVFVGLQAKNLDLSDNFLTEIPENISLIKFLSNVNLSHNNLTSIPESVSSLENLEKLDVSYNKLEKLPENIGNLKKLYRCDACNNSLSKLPETIGSCENLYWLDLSCNELVCLPESICKLTKLGRLFLQDNKLTQLPESLDKLKKLRVIFS